MANKAVDSYGDPAAGPAPVASDVETEPLRGEETDPREVFLLLV